jgi:hypothetical protein
MTIKTKVLSVLKCIATANIEKYVDSFAKSLTDFGDSMDKITEEMSNDVKLSETKRKSEQEKNTENIQKLFGDKSDSKIWSD